MTKPLYIGISGKARHGKDTVAKAIHALAPEDTKIIGLADALKAYCRVAYGMREKDGPLLQIVGTDVLRRQRPNIWTEVLATTAEESGYPIILIPDVRFRNEAQFVRDAGGLLVRVIRPGFVADDRPADHVSEVDLDDYEGWDAVLEAEHIDQLRGHARIWWRNQQAHQFRPVQLATMPPLPKEAAA